MASQQRELARAHFRKRMTPYAYMAPTMVWLLVFMIYPLIFALVMAFKKFKLMKGLTIWNMPWNGVNNFIDAFNDPYFVLSLEKTVIILVVAVTIEFLLGFLIAWMLNKKQIRWDFIWIALILSPLMMPLIASGNLWRMLLDVRWGAVNAVVMALGFKPIDFLGTPQWALPAVILVEIWQWTPFVIITLLAGLRSVPEEPREAAMVDGASHWQTFTRVILPHMQGQIMVVLLIRSMDVVKTFDVVYALTFGGPGQSTTVATFYLYRQAFTQFKLGYGAALSWIIFIMVYLISFLILRAFRRQESSI
jgi:multiple sugar transport system permease protein